MVERDTAAVDLGDTADGDPGTVHEDPAVGTYVPVSDLGTAVVDPVVESTAAAGPVAEGTAEEVGHIEDPHTGPAVETYRLEAAETYAPVWDPAAGRYTAVALPVGEKYTGPEPQVEERCTTAASRVEGRYTTSADVDPPELPAVDLDNTLPPASHTPHSQAVSSPPHPRRVPHTHRKNRHRQ